MVESLKKTRMTTVRYVITVEEYKRSRVDKPTSVQVTPYCETHTAYPINLYCNTCKLPICSACLEIDHQMETHNIILLKRVSDGFIKRLAEMIQKLNEQSRVLKKREEEATLFANTLEVKRDNQITSITQRAENSDKSVHYAEQRLLENLEKTYSLKIKTLQSDIDDLQMKYGKLVSMVSCIEMSRLHKNAAELSAAKETLNKRIEELLQMECKLYIDREMAVFQPCDDVTPGDLIGFFEVRSIPGSPFEFTVTRLVQTIGKHGKEDGRFDNPRGLAFTEDGNLAVADWLNNRIQVIDLDGKMVRTFTFTQFEKKFTPRDVAISKEGLHFMTDRENKQVVVSDVNGKFMRSFGQTELRHPFGIAIHPLNGNVYVTDWDGKGKETDTDGHYVRKYTQEGKYINSFGGYGEKEGQFKAPYSVDFDSKGKVYVSDFNNSRVQVFDESDQFVRSFGCYGENDGQFKHPSGIVVSNDNFVYVADKSANKIQKFDTNGRFLYRIDSDEDNLNHPRVLSKQLTIQVN
ncbi:tripartite motif-containing protein 2-like [Ptychodera flava]|uniref:tripartite motif-containing protein 2-like n=1 Tax=Ptychodera flava TaxID=63121 RepID=UPI00396A4027